MCSLTQFLKLVDEFEQAAREFTLATTGSDKATVSRSQAKADYQRTKSALRDAIMDLY